MDVRIEIEEGGTTRTPAELVEAWKTAKRHRFVMLVNSSEINRLLAWIESK